MSSTTGSLSLVYSTQEIAHHIEELATKMNTLYQGKNVAVICVLKGAFMFFSDCVKHFIFSPTIDFIRIMSYGTSSARENDIILTKDIEISIQNRHVLIIEDIVDTGHSAQFLLEYFRNRGAIDVKIATLLNKTNRREVDVPIHFSCFTLQEGFLVGYGLDYAEKYRELPCIYSLNEDIQNTL